MSAFLLLVAAAATGIEVGWQPLPEGGYEYTIQIEPELAESFVRGEHEIVSSVPANIDARRYRIVVGRGKLARVDGVPRSVATTSAPPVAAPAAPARSRPPSEPIVEEAEPPLETLAQPAPSDPSPPETENSLKDLPEPPEEETGPAIAVPLEPQTLPSEPAAANPFERKAPPSAEQHAADNAHLPAAETAPMLLKSGYEEATKVNRPPTDGGTVSKATAEPQRPWIAFVLALVLLCCSLGANAYLGWIAWDARARYRSALSKLGMSGAA
jgi:hypothetical protein